MAKPLQLEYEHLPTTLYPSRARYLLMSLLCTVFVALGIWQIRVGDGIFLGWSLTLFFGAGTVILAMTLLPGAAYLTLSNEGFVVCSLYRRSFTSWSAVQGFGVISIRGNRMVAYDYMPDYPRAKAMRSLSRSLADFEAALPTTYGMKAAHLAEQMDGLLVDYRLRHPQPLTMETLRFDKAE